MNTINETPSVVDIRRFPQREEEQKKAKKKYPQQKPFSDTLDKTFETVEDSGNNVIDITPQEKPTRTDTPDLTGVQKRENKCNAKRLYEG